jgi:nitroimidazol reductase NimA-like FMN-containing flavoprotein (pyridoxamine 5'-phosphate oxidase superfamily)
MAEMTRDEVYAYLDTHGGYAVLSTIGRGGYPHAVPLGFFRQGDDVILPVRGQRKVNIARNPKVAVTVESGRTMKELKGVVIQGDATLVEDPAAVLDLAREGARRRGTAEDQLPTSTRPGAAYVRVSPRRMASWDNTKP